MVERLQAFVSVKIRKPELETQRRKLSNGLCTPGSDTDPPGVAPDWHGSSEGAAGEHREVCALLRIPHRAIAYDLAACFTGRIGERLAGRVVGEMTPVARVTIQWWPRKVEG